MSVSVPSKIIENYVKQVRNWDSDSKRELIQKITNTLSEPVPTASSGIGVWQDDRDIEEVVKDIYSSRHNVPEMEPFE